MKGEAYIYKVNGEIEHLIFDKMPTIDVLRKAVGDGPIEAVPYWTRFMGRECVVFCNEHGKLEDRPRNEKANEEWYKIAPYMQKYDYLAGDIIILMGDREFMRAI